MVSSVVLTCLIACYLYLSFLSLHFTCIFHSQSFKKSSPNLLQVLQPPSVVVNVRFTTKEMSVKNNTHVARTSRNMMSTTWDLYCCLVRHSEALRTCWSAFPITTKWCFDQDVKVVPGTTFTKRMCPTCGSLQKRGNTASTSRLALHWKCGFRMPNTWKWPEMNMYLDLNLATFQYIDGFGCYHFFLNIFGLELINLFSFEILRNFLFSFGKTDFWNFLFRFGTAGYGMTAG